MCGRFALHESPEEIVRAFQLARAEVDSGYGPRYNIAPTDDVLAVRIRDKSKGRESALLRWGLVPHWAKDATVAAHTINARAETVAEKPTFRDSFRSRRCLVPADGFYEWQKRSSGKQPYYFRMNDGNVFAFAGLWDRWELAGESLESCTILTTEPNELTRPIHNRMPVILQPTDYDTWLDPDVNDPARLGRMLRPFPERQMAAHAVSTFVSRAGNEGPTCIEPLEGRSLFD
jgi:putative SOS response-associated peptidase YedK